MDLFDIIRNIPWRPGIGDPTVAGWLTVIFYFVAGLLALVMHRRLALNGRPPREKVIWFFLALFLFFLGFNKQLDLQSLLTAIGREIAKTQGWYGDRRGVQLLFIGLLATAGGGMLLTLGWLWRQTIRRHALIFAGLAALTLFVIIRAVSFHAIDLVIQQRIAGVRFNTILELGSLWLISFGLWRALGERPSTADSPAATAGRNAVIGTTVAILALAGGAAVYQLLATDQLNWSSAFETVVEPYEHPSTAAAPAAQPMPFTADFEQYPAAPIPFVDEGWDITVYNRDWSAVTAIDPLAAAYGDDCAPPPATHQVERFEDAVFVCDGRLVSAINGRGYAATILTPAVLLDFSRGPATLSWEMSTARTSSRDWIELWITPFEDNLQLPGQDWLPGLNGPPNRGIQLWMDLSTWRFSGARYQDGHATPLAGDLTELTTQSQTSLTSFELTLDRQTIRFGTPDQALWWVEDTMDQPLDWQQGVIQLTHHSFEPQKDCGEVCAPNSWLFDNWQIDSTVPFAMIPAAAAYINRGTGPAVTLTHPSPVNGYLRFIAFAEDVQVSFDGGQTWQIATRQNYAKEDFGFQSYWVAMPSGLTEVHFRARDVNGNDWQIREISVWGREN